MIILRFIPDWLFSCRHYAYSIPYCDFKGCRNRVKPYSGLTPENAAGIQCGLFPPVKFSDHFQANTALPRKWHWPSLPPDNSGKPHLPPKRTAVCGLLYLFGFIAVFMLKIGYGALKSTVSPYPFPEAEFERDGYAERIRKQKKA